MHANENRRKTWAWVLVAVVTLVAPAQAQNGAGGRLPVASISVLDSTREQDGLVGSVRRVKVQSAKLETASGQLQEGPLQLLEITTYSLNGNRIDNASYPVAQSSLGNEEYKYNERGNIIETTLRGNDGSILSRENYEYEYDTFGNWKKMVTSLVVFENGELRQEPVEVTYREISYFFDDGVARIVTHSPPSIALPTASSTFPKLSIAHAPEVLSQSDRPLSIDALGVPPELPQARDERDLEARSDAGSTKTEDTKEGPAAISLGPADGSTPVTKETSPGLKASANNSAPTPAHKAAVAYYEKGRASFDLGAFKDAVDFYQRALELEPESAGTHVSLGHAYLALKKNREAGKAYQQATVLNPEMAEAHYGLGIYYFGLRQFDSAEAAFKRATLLRPKMGMAHYGLALAYQARGKQSDSIAELRILQTLDRDLAKKLSDTFQKLIMPCRTAPFCY